MYDDLDFFKTIPKQSHHGRYCSFTPTAHPSKLHLFFCRYPWHSPFHTYIHIYIYSFVYSLNPSRIPTVDGFSYHPCGYRRQAQRRQHADPVYLDIETGNPGFPHQIGWGFQWFFVPKPIHWDFPGNLEFEAGWWFGTFVCFPYIWNNHPNWLIFFRGVGQPPTRKGFWDSQWIMFFCFHVFSPRVSCGNYDIVSESHVDSSDFLGWRREKDWVKLDVVWLVVLVGGLEHEFYFP